MTTLTDRLLEQIHAEAERQRPMLDAARSVVKIAITLDFGRDGDEADVRLSIDTRRRRRV